jgi:uncharacterized protein YbjQ (UPF0145 family)
MELLFTLGLLIVTYFIGAALERNHFKDILRREETYRKIPVINFETIPDDWVVSSSHLVTGSVVVSADYFKRFIAGLRALFGGRIKTYEPLLERARREAILRMIKDARSQGFDAVINVRIETSRLASARKKGHGTAGVEMLAYGTAINRSM